MRFSALALIGFLGACAVVLAQGQRSPQQQKPAQQQTPFGRPGGAKQPGRAVQQTLPKLNPQKDALDWVLVKWEQSMTAIPSFEAQCKRTTVDKVFKATEVCLGTAKYLRSKTDSLASLELKKAGSKKILEKYVCTGTFLYQYDPALKVVRVQDMPKAPPGQVADQNFLSFLFGMKAVQAKQRYQLRYIPPPKNDKWYYYVEIRPKNRQDRADFTRARLVLLRSNFMPRQLWFEQPNGSEVTWDFTNIEMPAKNLTVLEFQRPTVPPGWRMERVRAKSQPRILRNQK